MIERNIKIKDSIFLSYHDDKELINFTQVIQPLAQYLSNFLIKTFCMRDPFTKEIVTNAGESFIEKEMKSIRSETSIFIAYITAGYLESDECMRECAFIKQVIDNSYDKPIFILLYNSDELHSLKEKICTNSILFQLAKNDQIYLTAPGDFERAKLEIIKKYNEKIKESFNLKFKKSHLMSDLVLHSLKHNCLFATVNNYILQSKELTHKEAGYELHIVTDEINNYDLTVLSSLAIALNLQKKVKYIYYGSAENRHSFDNLKQVVEGFITKNELSRRKVDRYIRYTFNLKHELSSMIEELDKRQFQEFVDAFPNKGDILKKYQHHLFKQNIFKVQNIVNWLIGKETKDYNYPEIQSFNEFLQLIVLNEECNQHHIAVVLKSVSIDFNNLVKFSDWNVGNDELSTEEIVELEDDLDVPEEIRGWIGYASRAGSDNSSIEAIDEILENMFYVEIGDADKNMPDISYSFCIFYEKNDISCSWYRTAKGISEFHLNTDENSNDLDNDLIMYKATEHDNKYFIEMFLFFLRSSSKIEEQLKKCGSTLVDTLERYCKGEKCDD